NRPYQLPTLVLLGDDCYKPNRSLVKIWLTPTLFSRTPIWSGTMGLPTMRRCRSNSNDDCLTAFRLLPRIPGAIQSIPLLLLRRPRSPEATFFRANWVRLATGDLLTLIFVTAFLRE